MIPICLSKINSVKACWSSFEADFLRFLDDDDDDDDDGVCSLVSE